jgi:dTDP-4-amino-4,6-dideoxygalactose transaminase
MAWRIPIVDLESEHAEVGAEVERAALRVLRSGSYILGPEVEAFEAELAASVGAGFAVGVGSGTEALTLSLRALGVGPGDEVVLPAFTYFATVEAVLACGARPVFADVEPDGFNVDPDACAAALTSRTRALVPVHLFGRCADLPRLAALAERHGLALVEDAAQAIGAARAGRRAGAWGAAGCFSFYPSKNLGGAGDGGCVTTSDPGLAERLRLLRSHGLSADGSHVLAGTTSRLDAIQAAVLRAKLPYLKTWIDRRARNARIYGEMLGGVPGLRVPGAGAGEEPSWTQYTLRCAEPERVRAALEAGGIEWRHYYPRPACREPALGSGRAAPGAFPRAERACAEAVSIPVRGSLAADAVREIAERIRAAVERS